MEPAVILVVLLICLVIYFLPTIIAGSRNHNQAGAILVLNLFLGWTFLGWVIALVWSATNDVNNLYQEGK